MLAKEGVFVVLGAPEEPFAPVNGILLLLKGRSIQGSLIGSPDTIKEMLQVASKHNIKTWAESMSLFSSFPLSLLLR